jgi:signal transduction histidine kinase
MNFEFSIYALLMGVVTLLALFLLIYPLLFRVKSKNTYYFIAMIASAVIWCAGYALDIAATDFQTIRFLIAIEYIGIVSLTPLFLLFVLSFTNRNELSAKPILGLIFFPPIIHYLLLITNDINGNLFYKSMSLSSQDPFVNIELIYGPAFYSHTIYSYLLLAVAIFLLIHTFFTSSEANVLYRKQLLILVLGTIFPIIGNLIRIFKLIPPLIFLDLTPISFVIFFVLCTYALFEVGFLDITPIARQQIFDEILDGLVVLDQEYFLIDINPIAYEVIFPNLNLSEIYGKDIFSLLKNSVRKKSYIRKINEFRTGLENIKAGISKMVSLDFDILLQQQDIQQKYYNLLATPLKQKEKDIIGFVIIIRDISDRRDAERSLQEKNRLQELILRLLSHDLRNHINVLKGYSDLAIESDTLDDTMENLKAIDIKSSAIIKLIDEVSEFLKVENLIRSQQLERYDLKEVIRGVIDESKPEIHEKLVHIDLQTVDEPVNIVANLAINSVVRNLLQNAIKFSPKNGIIKITLEEMRLNWRFIISDQGPGIPDELKEKVFEPFISFGKNKGTGLGLTIAKETVEALHGKIWIEDFKPQGTTFIIEIPRFELV